MRNKKTLLAVEWTDVVIERVPILTAALQGAVGLSRHSFNVIRRGNVSRATRSAANGPRRTVQVFA